jgi:hypothetical protein
MLKIVLHALAFSESPDTRFLVILILPNWEDTPSNSAAICDHHNMSTLIRIPAGHMRFVPAYKQADEVTPALSPAKWPVEFVLIANDKGRESFICHDRIQRILRPAIQATCHLPPGQTLFSPTPLFTGGRFRGRPTPPSRRLLPTQPATPAQTIPRAPDTPPALTGTVADSPGALGIRHHGQGYSSSQPLPDMEDIPVLPNQHAPWTSHLIGGAPAPYPWAPKLIPEQWVYTDGSDITGHPRLWLAVVHISTNTTIYIDAADTEETRTIMRAKLAAIHTMLSTFIAHD